MTVMLVFLVGVAAVAAWWLSHQGLGAKPWLESGSVVEFSDHDATSQPAAKVGLIVFLAVVGALFALLLSAYVMRRAVSDWRPLPAPWLLWINTGVLIMSSVALYWAQRASRRDDIDGVRMGLIAGAGSAVLFLAGQLMVWKQLDAAGYYLAANPANAFFYLITATHGLHMVGGLAVLGRTIARAWRSDDVRDVRLSVELCATYWHFLLFVWLFLFSFLMRWVDGFIDFCQTLLT